MNDHSIEITDKINGRVVPTNKLTSSGDGKTLTTDWRTFSYNGKENRRKFDSERAGDTPVGANKISGELRPVKTNISGDVITSIYKVTADVLAMNDPSGDSYSAEFDGKDYPFTGNPGITTVSLKKIDENTIEETDKRKDKVIAVLSRDG